VFFTMYWTLYKLLFVPKFLLIRYSKFKYFLWNFLVNFFSIDYIVHLIMIVLHLSFELLHFLWTLDNTHYLVIQRFLLICSNSVKIIIFFLIFVLNLCLRIRISSVLSILSILAVIMNHFYPTNFNAIF